MESDKIPAKPESKNKGKQYRRRPTPQQRRLIRAKLAHPDATLRELGEQSGYTNRQHTLRALESAPVQTEIARLMASRPDLRREALADRLAEGLKASNKHVRIDEEGNPHEVEAPDWSARGSFLKLAFKLSGDDTEGKGAPDAAPNAVLVNIMLGLERAAKAGIVPPKPVIDAESVPDALPDSPAPAQESHGQEPGTKE